MSKRNKNATVNRDLSLDLAGGALMNTVLSPREFPRVIGVTMEPQEDGIIYDGKIVIDDPQGSLKEDTVEEVFFLLKKCFKGDYEKAPQWMVDDFRRDTAKHSRISITYTIAKRSNGLEISIYRSMGKGACGAHRLRKVLPKDVKSTHEFAWTVYNDELYYAVPLSRKEANYLMRLFCIMAVDTLSYRIFEDEVRRETQDKVTAPLVAFDMTALATI